MSGGKDSFVVEPMVLEIEQTILQEGMLEPGSGVLMAVSGGPDSIAMMLCLNALVVDFDLHLAVGHVNHGLRGRESDGDEAWVHELADMLGLPLKVGKLAPLKGGNLEERLREERYSFLAQAASEMNCAVISLAHHADDLAETFVLNLLRGAGPAGLAGFKPVSELHTGSGTFRLIRPLIRHARADVLAFLDRLGINFREDSMNLDINFTRNRIRQEIMPALTRINPAARDTLIRTAQILTDVNDYINVEAAAWLNQESGEGEGGKLRSSELMDAPRALRMAVLRLAVRRAAGTLRRFELRHFEEIEWLARSPLPHGSVDLPGLKAVKEYGAIGFVRTEPAGDKIEIEEGPVRREMKIPGQIHWPGPEGRIYTIEAEKVAGADAEMKNDFFAETLIDLESIQPSLYVRTRLNGDRYHPAGPGGSRKLKKIMNDLKLPPSWRDRWPLFADKQGLVWVPGARPAQRVKPKGGKLARLSISPPLLAGAFVSEETGAED